MECLCTGPPETSRVCLEERSVAVGIEPPLAGPPAGCNTRWMR
jgi:hypothetical protein